MNTKTKNLLCLLLPGAFILVFAVWAWFKPADEISVTERKKLTQFPKFSVESLMNGKFISNFESYANEQFPLRDNFRTIKAFTAFNIYRLNDMNDIYIKDGYIAKIIYPMNEASILNATDKFNSIINNYAKGHANQVYCALIPDKNMLLGDNALSMDYEEFEKVYKDNINATYIDILDSVSLTDYYKTDTHWKTERLKNIADKILIEMGNTPVASYENNVVLKDGFYGVYYGQAATKLTPDSITKVYSEYFEGLTTTIVDTGKTYTGISAIFNDAALSGNDPYEYFLYGSKSLITIENPDATSDKTLIVFRDSFGSSIAPYFTECYSKIYLADIRYIPSNSVCKLMDFDNADVLFIYSTLTLNSSETFK